MGSRVRVLVGAGVLALVAAAVGAPDAVGAPASGQANFAAVAVAAGLTAKQATGLQAAVDHSLAVLGGRQVAPNKIDLGGALLSVPVPGEATVRDIGAVTAAAPSVAACTGGADWEHFCAYKGQNYSGQQIDMYACKRYPIGTDWGSFGSWDNNQSGGARAKFYGLDTSKVLYTTPAPHSTNLSYNWVPIFSIVNC